MKKKKQLSKFDNLVERFLIEFSKIPNFDVTASDEIGSKMINIIIFRIAEVASYKELVCQHFIPAVNKAIFESKRDYQNSQYKILLKADEVDFEETLFETVRLAYVGLFHKLENYINDIIKLPEFIMGDLYETEGSVEMWAKEKFNFDIKNWQQFQITHKINWICNCVKHKDSFPVKMPKPIRFLNVDESIRLRIDPKEFKSDCELLIEFYPIYLRTIFIFAQHKLAHEIPLNKEHYILSPGLYEIQVEKINLVEENVRRYIEIIKRL